MTTMKNLLIVAIAVFGGALIAGCDSNGPNTAEDANAKIKALKPEERFEMIKNEQMLSPMQKSVAIDNLEVSDEQKAAWKKELGLPDVPKK
jgi:outer membrane murein-binding lipoprotein Lpp